MTKRVFLITIILLTGCADLKDLPGNYYVKRSPNVELILKEDSTFQLYNARTNPYLHPFEHPDEYFWKTEGRWKIEDKSILLTTDSLKSTESNAELLFQEKLDYERFEIATLDYKYDTIPMLQVKTDSLTFARFHGSMPSFKLSSKDFLKDNNKFRPPQKHDTLEISFYGYAPLRLPYNQVVNKLTVYQLKMEFNPNAFYNHPLKVGNEKLKDRQYDMKFIKVKTAGNKK